jgi:hypothetical protein
MGDYNRSTRECSFEGLGAEMVSAAKTHIEQYELGDILADATICIEVTSEKIKKGLFAGPGPKLVKNGIILTPRWLIQILKFNADAAFARSARLVDIVVSDYEKNPFYAKLPDNGMEVSGSFTDAHERSTSFIGLGKDAAGNKFKEMFIKAVQDAKK